MQEKFPAWSSYAYTLNNPITHTDPNGDCPWCPYNDDGMGGGTMAGASVRENPSVGVTPKSHDGKFTLESTGSSLIVGSLGETTISSPEDAVTGFYETKVTAGFGFTMGFSPILALFWHKYNPQHWFKYFSVLGPKMMISFELILRRQKHTQFTDYQTLTNAKTQ